MLSYMGKPFINSKMPYKCKARLFIPSKVPHLLWTRHGLGWRGKASSSRGWEADTSSDNSRAGGAAQPRLRAQRCGGVTVGRGLRKGCAEQTRGLGLGILDGGHITPRQGAQDGQRSSEKGLGPVGVLETLSGGL